MARLLTKRTKSVNPAGGVNPAQEPNVGQYGWTKADAAHVNQLITYVEACKKYADQAQAGAAYVGVSIELINGLYDKVRILYEKVIPLANNIEAIYNAVKTIQDDVNNKHTAIILWYNEILDAVDEIRILASDTKTFHDAAKVSADTAWNSAIRSETAAQKAEELVDDLKKGQVYRGTWDATTNNYPDHQGTNSVWDVVLPYGTPSHDYGGKTWRSGDRLVYIKDLSEYQQIATGGGVDSVNGKVGAVTITAGDVGAYTKAEAVPVIRTVNGKPLSADVSLVAGDVDSYSKMEVDNMNSRFVRTDRSINGYYLTTDITLKAKDVGAIDPDGSIAMTGTLRSSVGAQFGGSVYSNFSNTSAGAIGLSGNESGYGEVVGRAKGQADWRWSYGLRFYDDDSWRIGANKIYHESYKPTANDVGAWPANQVHTGGNRWADIINKVPRVNEVGVTELGAYLDMKEEKSDADFSWRWWAGAGGAGKLSLLNGASAVVAEFKGDGKLHLPASGITCQNRIDVRAGQNPMLELHAVGKHAYAQYVTDSGDWRFVRTDGAGGESNYQFVSFNNGDLIVRGKYRVDNHGNCGWNTPEYGAFRVNAVINMTPEALTKVFSHRVEYPGHWTLDQSYGTYSEVSGSASEVSHTFVSTDGGSFYKIWKLRNDGYLMTPSGTLLAPDGNISGSVWGGYLSSYLVNTFSPISDVRLKDVIGPSTKSAVDVVNQFNFKQYRWKDKPEKGVIDIGLIAQEVEEVDSNLVRTIKAGDEETMALDTAGLLSVALKAIQELEARVRELEAKGDS